MDHPEIYKLFENLDENFLEGAEESFLKFCKNEFIIKRFLSQGQLNRLINIRDKAKPKKPTNPTKEPKWLTGEEIKATFQEMNLYDYLN